MPITVVCGCGKRTTVGDPLAGKSIRCPSCREEMYIPAAPTPVAGSKAAKAAGKPHRTGPAVSISSGTVVLFSTIGVVVLGVILFLVGPVRVWHQWEAIGGKAKDNVTDVVTFGLQAYLSERGAYNPRTSHQRPQVDDVLFIRPVLAMSMPARVKFAGKTSQGDFEGYYYPKTGEIEANVAFGGYSFAGMVNISKATGSFPMTGRMSSDQPQAETNGRKLEIVWPKVADE